MAKRKRRFSVDDENVYGYDSRRWEEREKRGTNWEGPKRRTKKGREQEAKNRADETLGRVRSYTERRDEEISDLEKKVKADEDRPLFLQNRKKRRAASREAVQRRATRARGEKAMQEAEKESKKELWRDKERREAKEKMAKDREWRRSGGKYRERQKEMFKIPGWADWSEEKVKKFLEGGD